MAIAGPSVEQPQPARLTSDAAANAAAFQRLHPAHFLSKYVSKGFRPDGRKIADWRDVSINVGSISTANGSALVRMGNTTVVCGIKAEVAEPLTSSPNDGFIVPNIDLPAISSPKFKPGPPGDEAQTMSNWLYDLLTSSRTISPSSLCIVPGKAVWVLYIDIVCINYDGNAFDASVMAVMAALRHTRIHQASLNPQYDKVSLLQGETVPLSLERLPLSCSFGIFDSSYLVPDPTSFETPLLPTKITVALDEKGRGCLVRHEGLGACKDKSGPAVLREAWNMAEQRVKELRAILEEEP